MPRNLFSSYCPQHHSHYPRPPCRLQQPPSSSCYYSLLPLLTTAFRYPETKPTQAWARAMPASIRALSPTENAPSSVCSPNKKHTGRRVKKYPVVWSIRNRRLGKDAVLVRRSCFASLCRRAARSFHVIVESGNDVSARCAFEVCCFFGDNVVFYLRLRYAISAQTPSQSPR